MQKDVDVCSVFEDEFRWFVFIKPVFDYGNSSTKLVYALKRSFSIFTII